VAPDALDTPLTFEGVRAIGATLGSGVVLVLDDTANVTDLLQRIARFFRDESCGQCVPCRVGTVRQEELLGRLARGAPLGEVAQNTFAIAVAGRGFDARISTEFDVGLPDSACVYCGNCIGVCPTGALMFASEYNLRQAGEWDESKQTVTTTICPYCGVGCNLELHVQDNRIVKVTSPLDHDVTYGHLCVKGRFGFEFVQRRAGES
jgi:ferredoxin